MHVAWKVWSSHLQGLIEFFLTGQSLRPHREASETKCSKSAAAPDVRCHSMHAPASDDSLIVQLRVVQQVSVIATRTCAGVSASGWLVVCGRSF